MQTCKAHEEQSPPEARTVPKRKRGVSIYKLMFNNTLFNGSEEGLRELMSRMTDNRQKVIILEDDIRRYAALRMESLGCKSVQKHSYIHRVSQ